MPVGKNLPIWGSGILNNTKYNLYYSALLLCINLVTICRMNILLHVTSEENLSQASMAQQVFDLNKKKQQKENNKNNENKIRTKTITHNK